MRAVYRLALVTLAALFLLAAMSPAQAKVPELSIPLLPTVLPDIPVPGLSNCKEAPTPESPGQGIAGFFAMTPGGLPPEGDPFEKDSTTTINEQYGYAGLRWRTYDLGCGPDAMRSPDAVIGTAVSNWIMQPAVALAALTGSLTHVAFNPTFLGAFDPVIERVSGALHTNLFASWIPAALAVLGGLILFRAHRSSLSTTAAAIGWAVIVVILATALFRWPIPAGNVADRIVTGTLGEAVGRLDGDGTGTDPGTAVSSHVHESILYRSWLAGTFGSPDSETAKKFGPDLFESQALTWREAAEAREDPDRAEDIVEAKKERWTEITDKIREEDPEAYEHLTGQRSETRVGYAIVSGLGIFLALPFLLLSALLMLGCFLIVRLAVMIFPAFAVLGIFPSSRGLVTGLGRTVAAAVVNAIVFGIGAGVTVAVLGILFHPGGGAPGWLSLVLMPLFSYIMWVALKPFRRLTSMVNPNGQHFSDMADPFSGPAARGKRWLRRTATTAVAAAGGGAAGAAAVGAVSGQDDEPPMRTEAKPTPSTPPALTSSSAREPTAATSGAGPSPSAPATPRDETRTSYDAPQSHPGPSHVAEDRELPEGFVPRPTSQGVPPPPTEPEWYDGEEVYAIYRPDESDSDDAA